MARRASGASLFSKLILFLVCVALGCVLYPHALDWWKARGQNASGEPGQSNGSGGGSTTGGEGTPPRVRVDHRQKAEQLLRQGRKFEARNEFSRALDAERTPSKRDELIAKLDELNAELIFGLGENQDGVIHIVQSGEILGRIARQYGSTVSFIKRLNGLSNDLIRPGDRLRIVTGTMHAEVIKDEFELTVYKDDIYLKRYRVAVGKDDRTPVGTFAVGPKIAKPAWNIPETGEEVPYGDPRNVLGTRWMTLVGAGLRGYGIHGTWEPDSVGRQVTRGCIRMKNQDVEEVFDILPGGAKVIIRQERILPRPPAATAPEEGSSGPDTEGTPTGDATEG